MGHFRRGPACRFDAFIIIFVLYALCKRPGTWPKRLNSKNEHHSPHNLLDYGVWVTLSIAKDTMFLAPGWYAVVGQATAGRSVPDFPVGCPG